MNQDGGCVNEEKRAVQELLSQEKPQQDLETDQRQCEEEGRTEDDLKVGGCKPGVPGRMK